MNKRFSIFYYTTVTLLSVVLVWQVMRFVGMLLGYSTNGLGFLPYLIAPWLF